LSDDHLSRLVRDTLTGRRWAGGLCLRGDDLLSVHLSDTRSAEDDRLGALVILISDGERDQTFFSATVGRWFEQSLNARGKTIGRASWWNATACGQDFAAGCIRSVGDAWVFSAEHSV
jgi:hypothetical protein